MIVTICVFIKEVDKMENLIIFSKTKSDLIEKINKYIEDNEIEESYKTCLQQWIQWFNRNIGKISIVDLSDTEYFYRAYYNEGTFGIQVWKEVDEDTVAWDRNLYISGNDFLNDENTIILE